jgi:hypothetical protein
MIFTNQTNTTKTFRKRGVLLLGFCLLLFSQAFAGKISVSFRDVKSEIKSSELATNMLKIINGSEKTVRFFVNVNLPRGWTSLKSSGVLYILNAGDSIFVPVKVAVNPHEEGNISYLVTAGLLSESNQQFASASWYVQLGMESQWNASVNKTEAYFTNNSDTSSFSMHVENTGNSMEWYTVKMIPHHRIQVYNKGMTETIPPYYNFSLSPGADTIMQFVIQSVEEQKNDYRDHDESEDDLESTVKFPLRISIQSQPKNQAAGRTWKTTVDFRRNSSEAQFNRYNRVVLPLTMEMRLDNLFDEASAMSLNLYGNAQLSKGRTLSYRYQSFFSQEYYSTKAFKGNYHYLGYFTPKSFVEIGNITGWGNFGYTPSGRGIRGEYAIGRNKVGLLYIQNPDLFKAVTNRIVGAHHEAEFKKFSLVNYYQISRNDFSKVNGSMFVSGANFKVRNQHLIMARAGVSNENYFGAIVPFAKNGYGGNFNYTGTIRDLSFYFNASHGTKYYTGYRGISSLNYTATYHQDRNHAWIFTNSFYRQNPGYFDAAGRPIITYKSVSDKYELRYSITNGANNYSVRAAYYNDNFLNIHYQTRGVGLDYHPAVKSDLRFVANVFGSYIHLPEYHIPDYFTAQVRTSLRYKSFTTNVRYNYGPYQAYEHLRFATFGINHQSIYLNSYYGCWLLADKMSVEPSLNYSYETLYKRSRFSFRPQFYYFSKTGWQFNMYWEYVFNTQKIITLEESNNINQFTTENLDQTSVYRDMMFGIGLKKQFGVPVTAKKFFTTNIIIFKDLNGNGRQDKNEESIENVLVTIKPVTVDTAEENNAHTISERGEEVITDVHGHVAFRNMPRGRYMITAKPLIENSGWFAGFEQEIVLDKSKNMEIPFTQGVRVLGSIAVDAGEFSNFRNKSPELSRIRVTAVDSSGLTYSSLTGPDGQFEIYVPAGDYRVSINQKALGDDFILEQNAIPVTLVGGMEAYNISFHLKEKERQIKVKKFGKEEKQ